MRIITIGREFGSGGRELGKRLSDALNIPCYDQEIINEIAKLNNLDPKYVERISETDIRAVYPLTIGQRFSTPSIMNTDNIKIALSQQKLIKSLACQGDCVVVGRCADIILQDMIPLNLFIYADKESKIQRCIQRAKKTETQKNILNQMRKIDNNRKLFRELLTNKKWGEKQTYHLCINTSGKEIKSLIPAISEYVKCWYNN